MIEKKVAGCDVWYFIGEDYIDERKRGYIDVWNSDDIVVGKDTWTKNTGSKIIGVGEESKGNRRWGLEVKNMFCFCLVWSVLSSLGGLTAVLMQLIVEFLLILSQIVSI